MNHEVSGPRSVSGFCAWKGSLRPIPVIVEAGYTDTDASSVLHVPDLGLVVAGDVIYNGVHLYLSETSLAGLD